MMIIHILILLLGAGALAATAEEWRSRSIYQVFTDRFARTDLSTTAACSPGYEGYCGGSWSGITQKLDYIQGMGFDAIWISPVVKQIDDPSRAYHGYSAKDLYALNSNFGDINDLETLASALHDREMYLMVDVVPNHFAWTGSAETTDYSSFNPLNQASYFHPICWIDDYNNQTNVEECWLGTDQYPLPDVDTTQDAVRSIFQTWISSLAGNYSIDGIRIDSVKNVEMDFWPSFASASGVYTLGEVSDGDVGYACPYQNVLDAILGYPNYYQATTFFSDPSATVSNLVSEVQYQDQMCKDATLLGSFSENHDQARFASHTSDLQLAKNIIAFTVLADGIPIIYQGQEQHLNGAADPYDREAIWLTGYDTDAVLYGFVRSINAIRQLAIAEDRKYLSAHTQIIYSDDHSLAMQKGTTSSMVVAILNNLGSGAAQAVKSIASSGYAAGIVLTDVLSCANITVGAGGTLSVDITEGNPVILYPLILLKNTGWCGQ